MKFSPQLRAGTLIKRYKRFLADVEIDNQITTMHIANTGAMTGCAVQGDTVWFSQSDNCKRKYPYSWEITETKAGDFICVNTLRANQLVEEALNHNAISALANATTIRREVAYGEEKSRIDFLLSFTNQADTYLEVKSVTLFAHGQGYFPDAVTLRGQKHLRELASLAQQGHRAVLLFAVLHTGISFFSIAEHIDPNYNKLLTQAEQMGVEVLVYKAQITPDEMRLTQQLPWPACKKIQ